ncbi:MAG: 2-phosphosulfolactate phosphatase [Planctomycetes bacterium]|nr:2-phosphosulfolactate phosphatase [Planctomycetota bacterium]
MVVVDVLRAFTTAAVALDAGARELVLFEGVDEALRARRREPEAFLMGEEKGAPPPGFEHGNSPAWLPRDRVRGRRVLQRTGAGTRCAVAALGSERASRVFAASLVVAGATARAAAGAAAAGGLVTLVESGGAPEGDDAVADLLEALLRGEPPRVEQVTSRVRGCRAAGQLDGRRACSPPEDLEACLAVDRFDFAIEVVRAGDEVVARRV